MRGMCRNSARGLALKSGRENGQLEDLTGSVGVNVGAHRHAQLGISERRSSVAKNEHKMRLWWYCEIELIRFFKMKIINIGKVKGKRFRFAREKKGTWTMEFNNVVHIVTTGNGARCGELV